jgi:hypothetical protein
VQITAWIDHRPVAASFLAQLIAPARSSQETDMDDNSNEKSEFGKAAEGVPRSGADEAKRQKLPKQWKFKTPDTLHEMAEHKAAYLEHYAEKTARLQSEEFARVDAVAKQYGIELSRVSDHALAEGLKALVDRAAGGNSGDFRRAAPVETDSAEVDPRAEKRKKKNVG